MGLPSRKPVQNSHPTATREIFHCLEELLGSSPPFPRGVLPLPTAACPADGTEAVAGTSQTAASSQPLAARKQETQRGRRDKHRLPARQGYWEGLCRATPAQGQADTLVLRARMQERDGQRPLCPTGRAGDKTRHQGAGRRQPRTCPHAQLNANFLIPVSKARTRVRLVFNPQKRLC